MRGIISKVVGYASAFLGAFFFWLLGLGMFCSTGRAKTGEVVVIHGWACLCGGRGDQH